MMAKASSEAAEAKEIEAKAIDCAKEAGAVACEDSAVTQALAEVEQFIMADVDKVAQEAGGSKGKEVFGDFGEEIGKEAGLLEGRKVALDLAKKVVTELASVEGRTAGLAAAQTAAEEEIGKQDLAGMRKEKVSALRVLFQQIGATAGQAAGGEVAKAVLAKINMESLLVEVRAAA